MNFTILDFILLLEKSISDEYQKINKEDLLQSLKCKDGKLVLNSKELYHGQINNNTYLKWFVQWLRWNFVDDDKMSFNDLYQQINNLDFGSSLELANKIKELGFEVYISKEESEGLFITNSGHFVSFDFLQSVGYSFYQNFTKKGFRIILSESKNIPTDEEILLIETNGSMIDYSKSNIINLKLEKFESYKNSEFAKKLFINHHYIKI